MDHTPEGFVLWEDETAALQKANRCMEIFLMVPFPRTHDEWVNAKALLDGHTELTQLKGECLGWVRNSGDTEVIRMFDRGILAEWEAVHKVLEGRMET